MKPGEVTISENNIDNRLVVEVFGWQIDLSSILSELESALSDNSKIEEVRFIAGTIFNIDANLDKEVWRGRNIVVYSAEVIVCQPVHWNVSGKDSLHAYDENAGTAEDGTGLQGKDGYPGESGGNVLINAKRIKCLDRLIISSNGGNGSNGQDGGNGAAGKDGKGISRGEFETKFPPVCNILTGENLNTTYRNLRRINHTVLTQWAQRTMFFITSTYTSDVLNMMGSVVTPRIYDVFYKCMTEDGHRITFSFQSGIVTKADHAFLLYEGSEGDEGKSGGEYGLGGEGGKPGELTIIINNQQVAANINTKIGADGVNGKGGVNGRHGKKGWDMAYMDWEIGRVNGSWPIYYGRDEKSSLKLDYYRRSASDRVCCPYEQEYPYACITATRIENKTMETLEERNDSRSNSERQHHAKAVGKKTISRQRVLNAYSEFMNAVETEIKEQQLAAQRAAELEKQKQIEQEQARRIQEEQLAVQRADVSEEACDIEENQYDTVQEQIDESLRDIIPSSDRIDVQEKFAINRHVPFNPDSEYHKVKVNISPLGKSNVVQKIFTKSDSLNLDDWLELNTCIIDSKGLKQLMLDFNNVKMSMSDQRSKENKTKIKAIEQIFQAKYKLAALHETALILGLDQTIKQPISVQVQIASKHLTESKAKDNSIDHPVLGMMKQYIFENTQEQRNNIAKYIAKELKHEDMSLQRAMKIFVLETEYVELLNESLEALQEELRKPQYENIRRFWDGLDDKPLEDGVREMMERDETLKTYYDRWNEMKQRTSEYESDQTPCEDEAVKEKFITHIQRKGITSKSCRVLFSYLYNVNLKVYEKDEDYELVLREDHNATADTNTHILSRGNEFGQLKVNEEYLKLEKDRLQRDRIYGKILREMDSLNSIEDIDNYLSENFLLSRSKPEKIEEFQDDEKSAVETIASFFPAEERDEMWKMLEKVTFEICKQKGILQHMLRRFSYEGKDIFFNEMCFFINAVLDHFLKDGQEEYYFAWIVAANRQRYWVDEVILMQLETYFKKQLTDQQQLWREYMRKIDNKEVLLEFSAELQDSVCSVECIDEILYLLSSVPIESMYFEGIPLSEWGYYLKEHFWTNELSTVLEWDDDRSLGDATYYIRSVENTFGVSKAKDLLQNLKAKNREVSEATLLDILSKLHMQKWKLPDEDLRRLECTNLQEWISYMEGRYKPTLEEFKVEQLTDIIRNDEISSTEISKHLSGVQTSIHNIRDKKIMHNETSVALFGESEIKTWVKEFREKMDNSSVQCSLQTFEEMLAVIDRAIELKKGFRLRDTQRLTVLILLTNNRSTLAQVSTGEGKSLIVVALSLIKALLREKVDIVTSSSVLAKRDSEVYKDIYSLFGIDVSHNCSDNIEHCQDAYSMHQVVYGDLACFQRDYLLDRFYGKSVLGDRDFTNVIVDEVDSMLLDKGNNMLYLSHDIPGMDKLEPVYLFIWQMINNPNEDPENIDTDMVQQKVLNSMYNTIRLDDLMQLDKCLSVRKVKIIWSCLVNAGILNEEGHIISDAIDSKRLEEVLTPEVKHYSHRLNFLLKECVEREIAIKVPNYLKKFVERHLASWIISAINALLMIPGQSYVVDYYKSSSNADRNANIIILDNDTGSDQGSSQWDEALHQFLQLKHGCKLSMQSLKAVFVSNVTFFKMYKLLYGLTGTLGSQRERTLLKEIHEVAFVTIPNAKSKQFEEYEPIISPGHRKWIESIKVEANKLINEEKRSVLIICDTINDVDCIYNALKEMFADSIHTYTRDYQEFEVVEGNKQLQQGQIIIATNLAGRGTDIRITDGLKNAGGLHVMLTYLPQNIRIEEQAFGRAARSGDKGSGRLLIMVSSFKQFKKSKIIDLKRKRDQNELHRISDIKTYYEKTIRAEEICFDEFKKVYDMHRKGLDKADVPSEVKTILLQTCLDKWSFWLDEYNDLMEDIMSDSDDRNIPTALKKFLSKLSKLDTGSDGAYFDSNRWKDWVSGNPMRMVRIANYLSEFHVKKTTIMEDVSKKGKQAANVVCKNTFHVEKDIYSAYETTMSLYEDVIQNEPQFSEAAHYYRAYTLMKTIEWEVNTQSKTDQKKFADFKKDLREALRLFEAHTAFAMQAIAMVEKLKGNSVWYDDYKAQKDSICQLYQAFIRSIEDIFGHAVTSKSFVSEKITENLSEHILVKLIEKGVIARPKVKTRLSERQLYNIHKDYAISIQALRIFLEEQAGPIDEERFLDKFRKTFPLPSREHFWEILIDQKVLHSIKKYVLVDTVKLEVVDPSLTDALNAKVLSKTLIEESIELDKDQIVLYHDLLHVNGVENDAPEATSNKIQIFEKDNFITLIGREKFVMLTKKSIIRCNEKANIDIDMIASCMFPSSFDSISAEDIELKANIPIDEAKLILEELISRKILERNGDFYVMRNTEKFSKSNEDLLPSYPLYECSIRAILAVCFAYRLALSNVREQLELNQQPVRIKLEPNPYPGLFLDLVNQNIIRPMLVSEANLEEKFDEIFHSNLLKTFSLNKLRLKMSSLPELSKPMGLLLSKSLYISPADSERLYNQISSSIDDIFATIFTKLGKVFESAFKPIQENTAKHVDVSDVVKQVDVSDEKPEPDTKTRKIQFEPINQAPELLRYDMGKTVEQLVAQLKVFYEKETKSYIESVLKQLKPSLVGLKVPEIHLKSIREATKLIEKNYGTIDEEQLFNLNGLPLLLHMVEKRWSKEMLINVGLVVGIGVAQIIVGGIIEIWSAGLMTHVASGLMSEGISDIMYAVNSFKSGYFSWEDYRSEKWKSVLLTAATAGVAAYFSRGTKVSRIANKVAGPGAKVEQKEIAKLTGRAMIKEIGGKKVFNLTVKRIVMKTTQGFALGMAAVIVDKFTDDYLKSLIESIAEDMLTQTVSKVDEHKISETLKKTYDGLGEAQARKLMLELPAFGSNDWAEYISVTKRITSSLSQGFASAMQKTQNQTNTLRILSNISTAWVWIDRTIEIAKLKQVIGIFLNDLDYRVNEKFNNMAQGSSVREDSQSTESGNYDRFKAEIVTEWKMQLKEHIGRIISQHLVKPLLNDALHRVGKYIKRVPRNIKQRLLRRRMKRLQKKHNKQMKDNSLTDETKTNLKKEYHDKLLKIMHKTKSPSLFADIIQEGVMMDPTCVAACTPVVQRLLNKMGNPVEGIAVTIQGENGFEQTFCSGSLDGENVKEVVLQLKDNHFTFSDDQLNSSGNNCLYAAMCEAFPELKNIKADNFREQIADTIRTDSSVQHRIRQGWHRFPMSRFNAIGGRSLPKERTNESPKKRVKKTFVTRPKDKPATVRARDMPTLNSLTAEIEGYEPPTNCPDARSVVSHLYERLVIAPVELAGLEKGIAEKLNLGDTELSVEGRSNCKDNKKPVDGQNIHLSHILRGTVNAPALGEYPDELAKMHDYFGQRDRVKKVANVVPKIGWEIDKAQMGWKNNLKLDFNKPITDEAVSRIDKHLGKVKGMINVAIKNKNNQYNPEQIEDFKRLSEKISNTNVNTLYEIGKHGYRNGLS